MPYQEPASQDGRGQWIGGSRMSVLPGGAGSFPPAEGLGPKGETRLTIAAKSVVTKTEDYLMQEFARTTFSQICTSL